MDSEDKRPEIKLIGDGEPALLQLQNEVKVKRGGRARLQMPTAHMTLRRMDQLKKECRR